MTDAPPAPLVLLGPRTELEFRAILQFGDVLLYTPSSVFGRLIQVKTWSDFSHSELFLGLDVRRDVWAARDPKHWLPKQSGGGVNYWPLRTEQLAVIRRPRVTLDRAAVLEFCEATAGRQLYDWWGLMRFFRIGKGRQDRMFCSEGIVRAVRLGGPPLFDNCDADETSPGMLDLTRDLHDLWRLTLHQH